jgi:hypothetical protein
MVVWGLMVVFSWRGVMVAELRLGGIGGACFGL